MDPNAALEEIREILAYRPVIKAKDIPRLADLIEDLDNRLSQGEPLPTEWDHRSPSTLDRKEGS